MSTALPQIHHHPSPLQTLAPHLLPHLPLSLPLLRRLQFHPASPTAHILATFPPSPSPSPPPHSFTATYIDRHLAPETECWIFSTYEHHQPASTHPDHDNVFKIHARAQLLALLSKIAHLPSPQPILIIGSLHSSLLPLLGTAHLTPQKVLTRTFHHEEYAKEPQTAQPTSPLNGISVLYKKYLIPPSPSLHSNHPPHLPPHYTLSTVLPQEIPHTITRTAIPKTVATLAQLRNVGVRYHPPKPHHRLHAEEEEEEEEETEERGQLIAWAFLGADGSLTSLYTEPAHRGKGLAKAVGRALMRRMVEGEGEGEGEGGMGFRTVEGADGGGMVHSDVAVGNAESVAVAVGLGGREGWEVRWVSVELGRVEGAVGRFEGGW